MLSNITETALERGDGTSLDKTLRYAVVHENGHIDRFVVQATVHAHFGSPARDGTVVEPGGVESIQVEYLANVG